MAVFNSQYLVEIIMKTNVLTRLCFLLLLDSGTALSTTRMGLPPKEYLLWHCDVPPLTNAAGQTT